MMVTPVDRFDDIWVKREDLACWTDRDYPSGSKVRQYSAMAWHCREYHNGDMDVPIYPPCIIGCSADSAMQIYVAATAKQLDTKGIIYTAKRKVKSSATLYAEMLGAEINEIKPGYLSNIRKQARQRAIDLKNIVMWDRSKAIQDTIHQCSNIPPEVKRIIVPTGSGLTAAGVLVGSSLIGEIEVIAVCTSPMADKATIMQFAHMIRKNPGVDLNARLSIIPPITPYQTPLVAQLPDGTPLDPFYAAKAWGYMQAGDMLWPPGLRPVIAMPEICQRQFKNWKGPNGQGR